MYQKQILMEKLKEATASVLPISLIVMAISFVLVPVDAGLMLSFVIATAMLILGMGLFTLGADMSMSRIGNYMGSKLTKSRKLPLILTVSFALGVAITVAEPDLQVLAGNVPEIDTTVLILTVSVGVGFFLMRCMVRILFSISLRTMLIVFYAIVFAAAFLSDESILSVDASGHVTALHTGTGMVRALLNTGDYALIAVEVTCDHDHTTRTETPAACTQDGSVTVTCDDCGTVLSTEAIPATGHDYKDGKCTVCGAADPDYRPEQPENPGQPEKPEQPANPGVKTGDSGVLLYMGLMTVCALGACLTLRRRKTR